MADKPAQKKVDVVLNAQDLQSLLDTLAAMGFLTLGPTIQDGAITNGQICRVSDLPIGWTDQQDAGSYRLAQHKKKMYFAYAVGPHSWKKYLHPPLQHLGDFKHDNGRWIIGGPDRDGQKRAFLGVRPCELHALARQDTIHTQGPYINHAYRQRRDNSFIIAVDCSHPAGTCFCTSMNTGPRADGGFDLCLTEISESRRHFFIVRSGSAAGTKLLAELPVSGVTEAEIGQAEKVFRNAVRRIKRSLELKDLKQRLYEKFDDPHWKKTAGRCLSCGNCTMVCPTCFCSTVEDITNLTGDHAERRLKWDSCYTLDFSYIHGGSIRVSGAARYRQWLMHKLAYWIDQFGVHGCVGCGRCITWCPAGIDLTEEAGILQEKKIKMKLK